MLCDPVQIQQVLLNLVRNGIDAMFEVGCKYGNRITVSMREEDDHVEVAVRDCGEGVRAEVAERLFQAFLSTKSDGMGMGLAICKTIIDDHGGEIGFYNIQAAPQTDATAMALDDVENAHLSEAEEGEKVQEGEQEGESGAVFFFRLPVLEAQ